MIDPIAGIIALLTADGGVSYQTGGRIYGGMIPNPASMPQKCVRVQFAGGIEQRSYAQYTQPRLDFYSFGSDKGRLEASEVDRALWDCLHNVSRETGGDVLIHSVMLSGGPLPWLEPDTDWYGLVRSAIVQVSTEEIA